jgi:hypothetical protein
MELHFTAEDFLDTSFEMSTMIEITRISTKCVVVRDRGVNSNTTPPTNRSRKRQLVEREFEDPVSVDPSGENLTQKERELRITEAEILFPKYMA